MAFSSASENELPNSSGAISSPRGLSPPKEEAVPSSCSSSGEAPPSLQEAGSPPTSDSDHCSVNSIVKSKYSRSIDQNADAEPLSDSTAPESMATTPDLPPAENLK